MIREHFKAIDNLNPSDEAVALAVEKAIKAQKSGKVIQMKSNKINFKAISALAACMAVIIALGAIFYPYDSGNSFFLTASAATKDEAEPITKDSSVKVGVFQPSASGFGASVNESQKKVDSASLDVGVNFNMQCRGQNVEKIKYTAEGAVFGFPFENEADLNDSEYGRKCLATNKKIIEKTLYEGKRAYSSGEMSHYTSYTVDYDNQPDNINEHPHSEKSGDYVDKDAFFYAPIMLWSDITLEDNITQEEKDALYTIGSTSGGWAVEHSKHNDLSDDDKLFAEIFGKPKYDFDTAKKILSKAMFRNVYIHAEVTYKNGETETKTVKLEIKKFNKDNTVDVGARLI